jgi:transcriptional regulator with XRE-family HTH domain
MNIADGLRRFREKHGYTQETLAEDLGCTRGSVARWECSKTEPQAEYLLKICSKDKDFPDLCNTGATSTSDFL